MSTDPLLLPWRLLNREPCPFCGSGAFDFHWADDGMWVAVACYHDACLATGPRTWVHDHGSEDEAMAAAIRAWNARPQGWRAQYDAPGPELPSTE